MRHFTEQVSSAVNNLAALLVELSNSEEFKQDVQRVADAIHTKLSEGGILYTAGNGGSAAEAQHLSAEFIGRYRRERQSFPAIALTAESAALTAIGNDYAFDQIFSRQMEALGTTRDVLVVLTTSGNSQNIIFALEAAKKKGVTTIALLGKDGGQAKGLADYEIIVPCQSTAHIQEVHLLIIHAICESFDSCVLDG